jgi:hypothetical protein
MNKTYKKDGKLHKVESEERMKNILEAARHNLDHEIEFKVLHEHFYDNALYHSVCMTNYLLKTPKEKVNLETSDHETAFFRFVSEINSDLMVERKAFLISRLYDPKGKSKRCDSDLNRFRVKLATCKDSSLIRLPPCEATFKQHVLRTSLQTKIWMNAQ